MTTPVETNKTATESGPESPTTARPFEMDDDDVQETGVVGGDKGASTSAGNKATPSSDAAPPKPPRPVSEAQQNFNMLKEAFPSVDDGVIKAVLSASGGHVEPAFNALLEMTDPDAVKNEAEEIPPQQPPRPTQRQQLSQMEADELYARQLAEHYDNVGAYEARTSNRSAGRRLPPQPRHESEERERNFMEDDFPAIKENLRQGFLETQTKVNGWINTLKKKIEENFDEDNERASAGGSPPYRGQGSSSRRSNDYSKYDADPQLLSDDFAGMKFTADGAPAMKNRPVGGSSIYRPPPSTSPRPNDGRRVGFKDEPEEINMYDRSPRAPARDAAPSASAVAGGRTSKWQPLSSMDPNPISDNDPFSLGDSEDEREVKEKAKSDDAGRLKQATSEAMSESLVGSSSKKDEKEDS